jgi:hypothetical protein
MTKSREAGCSEPGTDEKDARGAGSASVVWLLWREGPPCANQHPVAGWRKPANGFSVPISV